MMTTGKVRFVGGPWHNQHREVELRPVIQVVIAPPVPVTFCHEPPTFDKAHYESAYYYLTRIVSAGGSLFIEYVFDGYKIDESFVETVPVWELSEMECLFRIGLALRRFRLA